MKVNFGFLCDYADTTGGKLNAMGIGFDTIYANTVPATHRQMFAVVSIEFSSVEVGAKEIALHIINADGGHDIMDILGYYGPRRWFVGFEPKYYLSTTW